MARSRIAGAAAIALVLPLLAALPASPAAASAHAKPATPANAGASDVRELTRKSFTLDGRKVETPSRYQPRA